MRFGSAAASTDDGADPSDDVVEQLVEQLHGQLDGQPPDMLLFFNASSPSAPVHGRDVAQQLRKACAARWPEGCDPVVLGTSWGCGAPGTGAIGGAPASGGCEELQESAALSLLGASLPRVRVLPFHAEPEHDGLPTLRGGSWADLALLPEAEAPHILLFTDPSQFGLGRYSDTILRYFDNALPFSTKVGGLVPGGGLISLDSDGGDTAVSTRGVGGAPRLQHRSSQPLKQRCRGAQVSCCRETLRSTRWCAKALCPLVRFSGSPRATVRACWSWTASLQR